MSTHPLTREPCYSRTAMRRYVLLSLLVWSASAQLARADFTQAQIGSFTNNGASALTWTLDPVTKTGTLSGTSGGYFSFTNIPGLPAQYNSGPVAANMTVTASTDQAGFVADNQINQPITKTLTIAVTQAGSSTNLLTATVTTGPPLLAGVGHTGALIASVPQEDVTFTSDVIPSSVFGSGQHAFTLSLSAISPSLSLNPAAGNLLNSFTAAGTTVFSTAPVPEPASLALLGLGCVALVGARRRFSRNPA